MNFNNTVRILTQIWNFRVSVIVIEIAKLNCLFPKKS